MTILDTFFDDVIEENLVKPPVAVLKELALGLEKRTTGLLVGEVVQDNLNSKFHLRFYIKAPSLNNYRYNVFEIEHDLSFYPLRIKAIDDDIFKSTPNALSDFDGFGGSKEYLYVNIKDQQELEEILKKIFSSSQVKRVINGLLAQIKSTN